MKAESRIKRRVIEVTEYRCVVCGEWFTANREALTCSDYHRVKMARMKSRGDVPAHALETSEE